MKKIVIFDIDNTIANIDHRLHYLAKNPVDFESFSAECVNDTPIEEMVDLLATLSIKYDIYFFTGREKRYKQETLKFILEVLDNSSFTYSQRNLKKIHMRPDGDLREDTQIKKEMLMGIDSTKIAFALDDRDSVVKMFRSMGIRCLQVATDK